MICKNEVSAATQKKPQSQRAFLCRDWNKGVIKVCVVDGEQNAQKMGEVLSLIHQVFHYKFEGCNEKYAEFNRDIKLSTLFDYLNSIPHEFIDFNDVWNPNGLKYHDAYWGF